jgi:putative hemolysin
VAGAEVLLLLVLIAVNGLLSGSEMAVASSRKARLQERAARGDAGARAALELAAHPNRFLATVQIGITLVGILTGAFGGATLAAQLDAALEGVPALAPYSEALSLGLVVVAITYLSLVFGELVPKRLALNSPERLAAAVARPMALLARLAGPAVAVLGASTDAVLRLLRVRPSDEAPVTEEEIRLLIDQGAAAGVFERAEQDLVAGVLSLADRAVGELMTPRTRLVALDVEDPPEVNARKVAASPHTHFPVYRGDLDTVVGIVTVKDFWLASLTAPGPDAGPAAGAPPVAPLAELERLAHRPLFVPETLRALRLLEVFRAAAAPPPGAAGANGAGGRGAQTLEVALVVGEHGGTEGLITLTDLLEAITADLPAPGGGAGGGLVQRGDGSWLADGELEAAALKERLGLAAAPDPDADEYRTVGGFAMHRLGRVPAPGDAFEWQGHRFEVVDMDGNRVDKVLVGPVPPAPAPDDAAGPA